MSEKKTRRRGRPAGSTELGDQTRARLYANATRLFAERGYEKTTMRAIAAATEVSPGLLYRYFPSKSAVVMELYRELSTAYAERARPLPEGTWAMRFFHAIDASFEVLGPHRRLLSALVPTLVGDVEHGLFSPGHRASRERVMQPFVEAACGATDAPEEAAQLGRVLYVAHLTVVLSWLLDKSPGQRASLAMLDQVASGSGIAALALALPQAAPVLCAADRFISEGLFGEEATQVDDA